MGSLLNNTALITGASSGIGAELARYHANCGGDLVLIARRQDKLKQLREELESQHSVKASIIARDLTEPDAAREIYNQIKADRMGINYLINNAGFGMIGKFHEIKWEDHLAMINLNVVALTALTRLFLPDFVKRNSGRILNISSIASLVPGPMQAVYYASKAFVTSLGNALDEELHNTNITVTTLMPGTTETEFARISGMDKTRIFSRATSAGDVAEAGYKAMLKGKLNVIAGIDFGQKILMSVLRFIPKRILLRQIRTMQEV